MESADTAWIMPAVHSAKKARRRAERRWRKTKLEVDRQIYRQARNGCMVVVNKARAKHVRDTLNAASGDPRKMFSIVHNLLGKVSSLPVLPDMDDHTAAETLRVFFQDKIRHIRDSFVDAQPLSEDVSIATSLTDFQPITEDQLLKIIKRCNPTSSLVDPIPTKLVIEHLDILLPVLVSIINTSFQCSAVPKPFKTAVIKPLLKKQNLDPGVCNNYRPVSNLPYVSKLLERSVAEQLSSHLNMNKLLDKFQSAYRAHHSCETALLRLLNDLLCNADAGNLTLLVLLDLSAAFDVIDHGALLERLQKEAGIAGLALQWFRSYLNDRTQRIVVGTESSSEFSLECGVPQGSVLGPILFSLYTAQLGRIIEKHGVSRKMFADDTELYHKFRPDDASLLEAVNTVERCCAEVKSWMLTNRLKLNDEKTEARLCGSKSSLGKVSLSQIQVGQAHIPLYNSVRNLGLYVDSQLTLSEHVNFLAKSCYFHIRTLGRLRPQLDQKTANTVAVSLIISRLDYCNSCLWGISKNDRQKLQRVQNTAARIVTRSKKTDHITPVLNNLHWLPVEKRIQHKFLSLVYNCLHDAAPEYLQELISVHQPQRSLRSASQFRLQVPCVNEGTNKKTLGARSFTNVAPALWNSLPLSLKMSKSSGSFRKALKTHLFKSTQKQ